MEFAEIVRQRYAAKSFDGRKIPKEKLDALLEMVRLAPSSFNLQPWKVKVVEDQPTKERLFPFSMSQKQVTTCSHLLVFCADTDIDSSISRLLDLARKSGVSEESVSAFGQRVRDSFQRPTRNTKAKRLAWAQRQTFLALGNALNGAKALGFDSCPMEGFDPKGYAKVLKLPKNLVPTALCPVGYADDTPKPKARFAKEEVFF